MTFTKRTALLRAIMLGASALTMTAISATPAAAQTTTSTVRGVVRDAAGAPVAGAVVTARNEGTNQVVRATTSTDGNYTLTGLAAAPYAISTTIGGATVEERVVVEAAQNATLDLEPVAAVVGGAAPTGGAADGTIVVTGQRLVETKTSEVATNVSRQQIENLPQNNRNFLNFAALAPGIRVSGRRDAGRLSPAAASARIPTATASAARRSTCSSMASA